MFRRVCCLLLLSRVVVGADDPIFDEDVRIRTFKPMDFPLFAWRARVEGVVVVALDLDELGKVKDASALSGPKLLIPAVLRNAKELSFQPRSDGRALMVYLFRLEGICPENCTSAFTLSPPNLAVITKGNPVVDH